MKLDQTLQGSVESPEGQPRQIRYGAPDGPRPKRKEKYDGCEPLEFPGHEAVAQHLAAPQSLRQFKSDADLAKHFGLTRMTIYRWKRDPDVLQRAHWLSQKNEMAGDLVARREWPRIMETAIRMAIMGDLSAMKFCESRAWGKAMRVDQSQLSATVSIRDLLGTTEDNEAEEPNEHDRQSKGGGQ